MRLFLSCFVGCVGVISALDKSTEGFLQSRVSIDDRRYETFSLAIELMEKNNARVLIETGTARCGNEPFNADGGSSVIFSYVAKKNDAQFYSVDISEQNVNKSRDACLEYCPNAHFIQSDSLVFLGGFPDSVDFLYLDSFDIDFLNPRPSQEHHLKEIQAIYPRLSEKCIVMIDDCDLPCGGKGLLAIDFLLGNGWQIIKEKYQVILARAEFFEEIFGVSENEEKISGDPVFD